jgi:hypothetical protein
MAAETDRTWLYAVGAVAVVWLLTSRKASAATSSTSSTNSTPERMISFPDNDPNVDLKPLFCAPWDTYGGWSDDRKVAEGTRLYVERWGFSPTQAFIDAVAKRDPCERRHFDALVNAFPPFPGQTFKASELEAKRKRQAEARDVKAKQDAQEKADCKAIVTGGTAAVFGGTAAIVAGVGSFGVGAVPAGTAGLALGAQAGSFISGIWC